MVLYMLVNVTWHTSYGVVIQLILLGNMHTNVPVNTFFFLRSKKLKIQLLMVMNIVIFFEHKLNQPHQFDAKFHE